MFLGSYHFDGDADALIPAYERLVASLPSDNFELHVCVRTDAGLTVFDTCPSREVFDGFTASADFAGAVAAAGLPSPRIEALGPVVQALGSAFVA
jgi:hypothetical protein